MAKELPASYADMYPGRFLKAEQLRGQAVPMKIEEIFVDELKTKEGTEKRGIVKFTRAAKNGASELALNVTNGHCLKAMFGPKPADAAGKTIVLVPEKTKSFGRVVDCIRIKGSPDIEQSLTVEIPAAQGKTVKRTLTKTGK